MTYPIPMQVHVIWHPAAEELCRPLAEKLYIALNRDAYQPLVPGIGIPVFFRCAGADPAALFAEPAPISVPDTEYDLRVVFLTPELVLDETWQKYVEDSDGYVARHRKNATQLAIALGEGFADGDEKVVVLKKPEQTGERVLQHVLLQACRLIAQRPRAVQGNLGAAPLQLFLSHTKRDDLGLKIAQAVKKYLDTMPIDRFFDEVSIQPGDSISDELKARIDDSAMVAIRTDGYVTSPWCRMEVAAAKRARRPMIVLDALFDKEPRSSPFLANLPSIRITADTIDNGQQLERVTNFLGLEVLRFLHAQHQLQLLQQQVPPLVPADAILLPRQPELRDFAILLQQSASTPAHPRVFVHPDPVLSVEESDDYAAYQATFMTPTSLWSKKLVGLQLGISVSLGDDNEQRALGLSRLHLEDATRVVARQVLAGGATLVYGGALAAMPGQFTEVLFEMIGAYNRGGMVTIPPLINYAAWPWSEEVDTTWLASRRRMLTVKRWPLPDDLPKPDPGTEPATVARFAGTPEGRYLLARSLSHMRTEITARTDARIVLGGKPAGFMGTLPGIVEEVLLAVRARQPLYVLGGFGGAAGLVTRALRGEHPKELTLDFQQKVSPTYADVVTIYERERASHPELKLPAIDYTAIVQELTGYGLAGLARANGLSESENLELLATGSIDSALFLVMKGLSSINRPLPPS